MSGRGPKRGQFLSSADVIDLLHPGIERVNAVARWIHQNAASEFRFVEEDNYDQFHDNDNPAHSLNQTLQERQ